MDLLVDWLAGQEKSLRAAALRLARNRFDLGERQVLYKDLLRSQGFTGFGSLADAVRLSPQMFKLTKGGFYFKRASAQMSLVRPKEKNSNGHSPKHSIRRHSDLAPS